MRSNSGVGLKVMGKMWHHIQVPLTRHATGNIDILKSPTTHYLSSLSMGVISYKSEHWHLLQINKPSTLFSRKWLRLPIWPICIVIRFNIAWYDTEHCSDTFKLTRFRIHHMHYFPLDDVETILMRIRPRHKGIRLYNKTKTYMKCCGYFFIIVTS